jgi:hypothetical protein
MIPSKRRTIRVIEPPVDMQIALAFGMANAAARTGKRDYGFSRDASGYQAIGAGQRHLVRKAAHEPFDRAEIGRLPVGDRQLRMMSDDGLTASI